PYTAPHLGKYGQTGKRFRESPNATPDLIAVDRALEEIQANILPYVYADDFDPAVRGDFVKCLMALQYGDPELAQLSIMRMTKYYLPEGEASPTLHDSQAPKELMLTMMVGAISSGQFDKAHRVAEGLPNELRDTVLPTVEKLRRQSQFAKGLDLIAMVFEERLEQTRKGQTAWLHMGTKVDAAGEKKLLEEVLKKAAPHLGTIDAGSPLSFLEKIPDLSDAEKAFVARLRGDAILKRVDLALRETDKDLQASTYFYVAEQVLFKAELLKSAHTLTQHIVQNNLPKSRSREGMEVLSKFVEESLQSRIAKSSKEAADHEMKELENNPDKAAELEAQVTAELEKLPEYQQLKKDKENV
ncbi:MAG: hypothetical protein ACREP8_03830, partial [Candidatus Binatia bacterium]